MNHSERILAITNEKLALKAAMLAYVNREIDRPTFSYLIKTIQRRKPDSSDQGSNHEKN